MPNSSLAVTGGNVDTETQVGGDHRQVLVVGDPTGVTVSGVRPDGFFNVRADPATLLFDTFETVDTVDTWTLSGTVPPTGNNGTVSASAGTAANATSIARTKAAFTPGSGAFLQYANILQIEAAVLTGACRWWGLAVPNASPTVTTPVTNGSIFELDSATGALFGRVYSNGAKTQEVALTRPTDGALHRYQILYRASRVYFNIDSVEVGSLPFPSPNIQALPVSFGTVNGGTALGTAAVLNLTLVGVGDTARNGGKIVDSKFPWRTARVSASGEVLVTDSNRVKQAVAVVHSGRLTVGAAADAAGVGRVYVINPVGSTVLIELRRCEFMALPTAVTAFPTTPRFTLDRFTFTGTATGATLTPAARDSTEPALVGSARTVLTGMTITAGASIYGFLVPPVLTGVGVAVPVMQEFEPNENGRIVLRAGQGVMLRQADAGTTADTRVATLNFAWAEYTVMT